MAIKEFGSDALPSALVMAGDYGNLNASRRGEMTVVDLGEDEIVAISKIPAHALVRGLIYTHAALGSTTGLTFGYAPEDLADAGLPAAFATIADTSAAGASLVVFEPFVTTKDLYITATQTGAGTAAGKITASALYEYLGEP
jgi:hypothetical protein